MTAVCTITAYSLPPAKYIGSWNSNVVATDASVEVVMVDGYLYTLLPGIRSYDGVPLSIVLISIQTGVSSEDDLVLKNMSNLVAKTPFVLLMKND